MEENDSQPHQTSGRALNWIFALATTLVACAIAWVGWNCIESVQKNAGKLNKFHVTADNTKIDMHRYDVVKNELDSRVFTDQLSPSEDLQAIMVKQEGSELVFSQATKAVDKKQYTQAEAYYSQILAMIPEEAKKKSSWYANGMTGDRRRYTMWVYRQRAICYRTAGDNVRAIADLTEAIKLMPDNGLNYRLRGQTYYLLGKKTLGDADTKIGQALLRRSTGLNQPRLLPE